MRHLLLFAATVFASTTSAEVAALESGWKNEKSADAMSDKPESHAYIENESGRLTFMCTLGGSEFLVAAQPKEYLGGGLGRYELRNTFIRFDDEAPQMNSWKYVDRYAVPYDRERMMTILDQVLTHKRLRIRLQNFRRDDIDLDFDLTGARAALEKSAAVCQMGIPGN